MPHSQPARRRKDDTSAPWILTFADLLSLVLTFFVLVFSMNTVQYESWKAVVHTMNEEFNPKRPMVEILPHDTPPSLMTRSIPGLNLTYLEALLDRQLKQVPLFQEAVVHRVEDTVVISLPASLLFEPKLAVLAPDANRALRALAGALVQVRNKVQVAGYTNGAPVKTGLFRSNWELSLTRARVVAGTLSNAGYQQPMTVLGYADTRLRSLEHFNNVKSRYEWAERIDIVLINEKREQGTYDIF
ncbi:OmpA/MotB family protein [Kordiimonas gwangyangensis]|uniref:OmpA/MotB family protein n=1 Tax=Kordiimonas gwangyangensis TaxID=288022 RepID=UPI0003726902|nr:flagellar motor protein MotB [Kordiimonas gwangyangensis]